MWQWENDTHISDYICIVLQFIAILKNSSFLTLTYMFQKGGLPKCSLG